MSSDRASRNRTEQAAASLHKLEEAKQLQSKARRLELDSQREGENLSAEDFQRARELISGVKATIEHKESAFKWLMDNPKRTQAEACKLLGNGTMPGMEGVKVLLKSKSLSKFVVRKETGQTFKEGKGRPQILSEETCKFITRMLEQGSSKNKAQLFVQIATFMRTMLVLKEGILKVEELDIECRSSRLIPGKGRRTRARRKRSRDIESEDSESSSDETEDENGESLGEAQFKRAMSEIFGNTSKGFRMVKAGEFAWPSLKTVRAYAKRYGWGIRKAQQQASWRFDAANPEDVLRYFSSLKETRLLFEITTAEQIHGGDELRLCAEFQQTGELLEVMVANGPEHCRENHAGRKSGSKSANGRLQKGLTFFESINMNKPDHVAILREGVPNKEKENALREACKALRDANIPYDIISTPTGYQDAESFEKCMMHLLRAIHKSEVALGIGGFEFEWRDPQNPTWNEIPPLPRCHEYQLDNASCHSMDDLPLRRNLLLRGLVLHPLFTNTTDSMAALDQHCHKIMKMFVRKDLLTCFELEISGGIRNDAHAVLLAAGMNATMTATRFPKCCKMTLAQDMDGDERALWLKINRLLTMDQTVGEKWTDVRLAAIACPSLAAGLQYCTSSFLAVGQGGAAATDLNPQKVLDQPIMIGGKEIWEARKAHSELELNHLHTAAGRLTGCLSELQTSLRVSVPVSGDDKNEEDMRIANTLWGGNAPPDAWAMLEMIRRAKELHQLQDRMGKARGHFERRVPVPLEVLQERINAENAIQNVSMNEYVERKHPVSLKAFREVVTMCETIKKALEQSIAKASELETQRSAQGTKAAKWNREKEALLTCLRKTIDGAQVGDGRKRPVKSLHERIEACKAEEVAAKQRRDKFITKCQELLVPAQLIQDKVLEVDAEALLATHAIEALTTLKDDMVAKLASVEALEAL